MTDWTCHRCKADLLRRNIVERCHEEITYDIVWDDYQKTFFSIQREGTSFDCDGYYCAQCRIRITDEQEGALSDNVEAT